MYRIYNSPTIRLIVIFGAILGYFAVGFLDVHAGNEPPTCLLIDTGEVTELLNPATSEITPFKFPEIASIENHPVSDSAYSPDGTHRAIMRGANADDLTVETFTHPYPISTFEDTFRIIDATPPTTIAWSPDSKWVAVLGNTITHYLTIMDSAGNAQRTVSLDFEPSDIFFLEWSGDSQFLLIEAIFSTTQDQTRIVALYHIPDLKQVSTTNQVEGDTCHWAGCWATAPTQHRLAYTAPDQPSGTDLVLWDRPAVAPKRIPLAQDGHDMAVSIAPNGGYVATALTFEMPDDTVDPISSPLWVYQFDNGQGVYVADVAETIYQTKGQMGGDALFPEMKWSADGSTLYYMTYAETNTLTQLWAYRPDTQQKRQIASWKTTESPSGYRLYVAPDNQRITLSANPHWHSRVQLIVIGAESSELVPIQTDGRSSAWSSDSRYFAVGYLDRTNGTLSINVFDHNGKALNHTKIEGVDNFFDLNWTSCQVP